MVSLTRDTIARLFFQPAPAGQKGPVSCWRPAAAHSGFRQANTMRLQQLEIAGFKSFSDRAHVAFDKGVTAIVGPNGCGKSNLADAITWVLGEQSAKSLRGDRMEDVIFSGSDARKPTAAAEVRAMFADVMVRPSNGNGRGNGNGNGWGGGNGHGEDAT